MNSADSRRFRHFLFVVLGLRLDEQGAHVLDIGRVYEDLGQVRIGPRLVNLEELRQISVISDQPRDLFEFVECLVGAVLDERVEHFLHVICAALFVIAITGRAKNTM